VARKPGQRETEHDLAGALRPPGRNPFLVVMVDSIPSCNTSNNERH